ncbi:MAG: DUF2550 domain-containing protein [Frankiales bacterium]|nr:DUF2550 domain-containing protein [Frankiales bacterium]
MLVIEVAALVLLAPCLLLLAVAIRRRLLARSGGTIELSFRLSPAGPGQGWVNGVGRFSSGGELRWYRVFSLSPRPRRVLLRRELVVLGRRTPDGSEARALHSGSVVLECRSGGCPVGLALDAPAVTGFLAWLESRPPGATLPR